MGKIKVIKLDEKQKAELEKGYREGESHALRARCHLILLKSKGQTSREVAAVLGCCEMAVNNWVKRYLEEGIKGLETRPGRGGKPILKAETDLGRVRFGGFEKPPKAVAGSCRIGNRVGQEL